MDFYGRHTYAYERDANHAHASGREQDEAVNLASQQKSQTYIQEKEQNERQQEHDRQATMRGIEVHVETILEAIKTRMHEEIPNQPEPEDVTINHWGDEIVDDEDSHDFAD
ncbi:hypothetical protein QYF36_014176 [Acer negundo]|nr:hypothetical protein QYF36_014176 [Acer negundo]